MGITKKNTKDRVTYDKETVNDYDFKLDDTKKMHSSCVVNFELKHVKDLRKSERCFPNDPFYFFVTVQCVMDIVNVNAEAMYVFA